MTKLFLLQSGFVTPSADFLVKEEKKELSLRDRLYLKDTRISTNDSFYDEKIEKLFKSYRQDNSRIQSFEFREDILKSAIRAFSHYGATLVPWVKMQLSQRTVGYLHRQYLLELFTAANGGQRKLDNYTYYRLLSPIGNNDVFNTGKVDIEAELDQLTRTWSDLSLAGILTTWTKDIEGMVDLLKTLHVIFGRRVETMTTPSRVS